MQPAVLHRELRTCHSCCSLLMHSKQKGCQLQEWYVPARLPDPRGAWARAPTVIGTLDRHCTSTVASVDPEVLPFCLSCCAPNRLRTGFSKKEIIASFYPIKMSANVIAAQGVRGHGSQSNRRPLSPGGQGPLACRVSNGELLRRALAWCRILRQTWVRQVMLTGGVPYSAGIRKNTPDRRPSHGHKYEPAQGCGRRGRPFSR